MSEEGYTTFQLGGKDVRINMDRLVGNKSRFSDKNAYQKSMEDAILSLFEIYDHSGMGASKGTGVLDKLSHAVGLSSFPRGYSQPEINNILISKRISPNIENANYLTEHLIKHGTYEITKNRHHHILKPEKVRNAGRDIVYSMSCVRD